MMFLKTIVDAYTVRDLKLGHPSYTALAASAWEAHGLATDLLKPDAQAVKALEEAAGATELAVESEGKWRLVRFAPVG